MSKIRSMNYRLYRLYNQSLQRPWTHPSRMFKPGVNLCLPLIFMKLYVSGQHNFVMFADPASVSPNLTCTGVFNIGWIQQPPSNMSIQEKRWHPWPLTACLWTFIRSFGLIPWVLRSDEVRAKWRSEDATVLCPVCLPEADRHSFHFIRTCFLLTRSQVTRVGVVCRRQHPQPRQRFTDSCRGSKQIHSHSERKKQKDMRYIAWKWSLPFLRRPRSPMILLDLR